MVIIDDRLFDAKTEQQISANFNRTLQILDTLADVVAEIEDSQLFKVVFDSKGGSAVSTQYVIEGNKVIEPENPTKEGYTFVAWLNGDEVYDFDTEVTKHLQLEASWEAEQEGGE